MTGTDAGELLQRPCTQDVIGSESVGRLGIGLLPKDFQALDTQLAIADGNAVEVIGCAPLGDLPA